MRKQDRFGFTHVPCDAARYLDGYLMKVFGILSLVFTYMDRTGNRGVGIPMLTYAL